MATTTAAKGTPTKKYSNSLDSANRPGTTTTAPRYTPGNTTPTAPRPSSGGGSSQQDLSARNPNALASTTVNGQPGVVVRDQGATASANISQAFAQGRASAPQDMRSANPIYLTVTGQAGTTTSKATPRDYAFMTPAPYTSATGYSTNRGSTLLYTPQPEAPQKIPSFMEQRSLDTQNLNKAITSGKGKDVFNAFFSPLSTQPGRVVEQYGQRAINNDFTSQTAFGTKRASPFMQEVLVGTRDVGRTMRTEPTKVQTQVALSYAGGAVLGYGGGLVLNKVYSYGGKAALNAIGIDRAVRVGTPVVLGAFAIAKPREFVQALPQTITGGFGFAQGYKLSGVGVQNIKVGDLQSFSYKPSRPVEAGKVFTTKGSTQNTITFTEFGKPNAQTVTRTIDIVGTPMRGNTFSVQANSFGQTTIAGRKISLNQEMSGVFDLNKRQITFFDAQQKPMSVSRTSQAVLDRQLSRSSRSVATTGSLRLKNGEVIETYAGDVLIQLSPKGRSVRSSGYTLQDSYPRILDQKDTLKNLDVFSPQQKVGRSLLGRRGQLVGSRSFDTMRDFQGTESVFDPGRVRVETTPQELSVPRSFFGERAQSFGGIPLTTPRVNNMVFGGVLGRSQTTTRGLNDISSVSFSSPNVGASSLSIARSLSLPSTQSSVGVGSNALSIAPSLGISQSTSVSRTQASSRSISFDQTIPFVPALDIPPPPFIGGPGFGGMPLFGFGGGSTPRGRSVSRKYQYTPSLTAGFYGIRGRAPKTLLTGLEVRPLPTQERRSRGKKRRGRS